MPAMVVKVRLGWSSNFFDEVAAGCVQLGQVDLAHLADDDGIGTKAYARQSAVGGGR